MADELKLYTKLYSQLYDLFQTIDELDRLKGNTNNDPEFNAMKALVYTISKALKSTDET